jgi:hypothetical protein
MYKPATKSSTSADASTNFDWSRFMCRCVKTIMVLPCTGFVVALLVVRTLAQDASSQDERIAITGKCVDEAANTVSGAKVKLFRLHRQDRGMALVEMVNATKTAEGGTFRFPKVRVPVENADANETIMHYLVATHSKWARVVRVVHRDRPSDDIDLVFQRAGQLDGTVTDDKGLPVAGAVVYRPSIGSSPVDGVWSCVTDGDGRFAITDLPEWNAKKDERPPGPRARKPGSSQRTSFT